MGLEGAFLILQEDKPVFVHADIGTTQSPWARGLPAERTGHLLRFWEVLGRIARVHGPGYSSFRMSSIHLHREVLQVGRLPMCSMYVFHQWGCTTRQSDNLISVP